MNGVADAKIDLHGLTYVVEARMKTNASTDILSRVANRLHGYRRRLQDDTVRRIGNCRALFDESYECCLVFFYPRFSRRDVGVAVQILSPDHLPLSPYRSVAVYTELMGKAVSGGTAAPFGASGHTQGSAFRTRACGARFSRIAGQ